MAAFPIRYAPGCTRGRNAAYPGIIHDETMLLAQHFAFSYVMILIRFNMIVRLKQRAAGAKFVRVHDNLVTFYS